MRPTRWVLAALFPLTVSSLTALPLAACGSTVAASPGAAYDAVSPPPAVSPASTATAPVGGTAMSRSGRSAPVTPAATTLTVRKTPAGYVLATAAGRTVYTYSEDKQGSGKSACTSGCLSAWPAVTGRPSAAVGVRLDGPLGTIIWPDGTVQATYDGYPLYTYAADTGPGQASGDGEGGVWHVVKIAG
jgi:predicted lipoprotein with Yx(FWY)xxD motif